MLFSSINLGEDNVTRPNFEVAEQQTVRVIVRRVDHNDPPLEADGPEGRRFLLNTRVMGELWGKVAVGDVLEVDI